MKITLTTVKAVGLLLGMGLTQVMAVPVNITRQDNDPRLWGFNGAGSLTAGGYNNRGNFGIGAEDNETEVGTISGQQWDMEAFVLNGTQLSIVAGFDLLNGVQAHNISAGDLFIKVGGGTPAFSPTNFGAGNVRNSVYNYNYAIDLSKATRFGNASFGPTAQVYSLSSTTWLNSTIYDQFGANPWKYDNNLNAGAGAATAISYVTGVADNAPALQALGLGSLVGGYHNILTINLNFLTGTILPGTPIHFSYTMECGNDSLKGFVASSFFQVPDSTSSLLLVAAGMLLMIPFGLKRRKA
jgi:hypothetical protein